jgi:hypothetical protein
MKKLIIIYSDVGAAKNLIKNVISLHKDVFFPFDKNNRLEFYKKKLYSDSISIGDGKWTIREQQTKKYFAFGIDDSYNINDSILENQKFLETLNEKNIVIETNVKETLLNFLKYDFAVGLAIAPKSSFAAHWQVRAYVTKIGDTNLQNFTLESNNQNDIKEYINKIGMENWTKENITNFYEVIYNDRNWSREAGLNTIDLDYIINPIYWEELISKLKDITKIDLDQDQSIELIKAWHDMHWKLEDTKNWKYGFIDQTYKEKNE